MAIIKVQDDAYDANTTSPGGTTASIGVNFTSTTGAGNLLICVLAGFISHSSSPVPVPSSVSPSTSGVTWVLAGSKLGTEDFDGVNFYRGYTYIYYALNAASVSSATATTGTIVVASAPSDAAFLEETLFEFSGLVSSPLDQVVSATASSDHPSAGSITATQADLLFVAADFQNDLSDIVAGSGFTIATSTTNNVSNTIAEYKLNVSPGSYTAAFAAGGSPHTETWTCVAVAFSPVALGSNGTATPSGAFTAMAIAAHNPTAFGTSGDGGGGGSSDGGATGCGSCPGPHLLELIPGFSDIPDSVLEADDPAFALHLGEIAMNATFGMVRLEVFPCLQKHGDTIPLPMSCWDGYKYSREELNYFWTVQNSTDPSTRWISGPDSMWFSNWNVDQETGLVFSEEWYERSSAADTRLAAKSNDGSLMVFCIGQRQKNNVIVATTPSYTAINEAKIATDKPYTQELLQTLNNNAKFSWINTEFFYLGTYVDGNTVALPVSQADDYHYTAAECKFLHAWRWTADGGDYTQPPGQYEQAAPFKASISASGVVSITITFITNGGEDVIPAPSYGRIAAFAFCTRSATPSSGTLANNFTELALDFFSPGATVRASELLTIKRNIDEAILSPEFFGPTEYADADVVPLPVSTVDSYPYSRQEVQYIWSWSDTNNSAPGNSHVRLPLFFGSVDPTSGIVKLRVYRLPPGGPYLDDNNTFARIKVLVMATRQAIHSELMLGVVHDGSIVTPSDSSTVVTDDSGDLINGN